MVVLGLPHRVSAHAIEELVKVGRLRGRMQKFKGGELAAQFPPQGCGPGPPPKVGVAGGVAQVDVDHIGGGGVEGCCPAHNNIHGAPVPPTGTSPAPIDGGRRGGLGSGRGCRQRGRAATTSWRAVTESARTCSKKDAKKGF